MRSKAMQETVAWVESQRAAAKPNFALGKDKFQRMLADTEMVTTPVDQLERIGRADLASNQKLLGEACARYAPGQTIQACMAKMNANKPEGGAVAGARAQLAGLKQFIIDHDIVTIPGPEEAKVEEAPPYNRQNFAYINIPGPYEKNLPSVYYIAPPDPTWPKAEQDAFVPGQGRPAVHLGPRSVAGPLPQLPPRQPLEWTSSARCSSATPSPKAGRITPRR